MNAVSDEELPPEGRREERLEAARPDPDELAVRPAYMPKIRWGWLVGAILVVSGVYLGYQYREGRRADALRADILQTHDERLEPIVERYRTFRAQIEDWTMEAAHAGEPERWSDPRLRIAGLHGGEGLYLRLQVEDATSREGIERGARAMGEDAITRCLGIAPASVRGLYENGEFLMPAWIDAVRDEPSFMRLRVLDDALARSISVDVPVVSNLLRAQYFLLVLQHGPSRRDAPVDIYLWDLREGQQLLRTRIQARGVLIPVRIEQLVPGARVAPAQVPPSMTSPGATDCSIAAQVKAITGDDAAEIGPAAIDALRGQAAEAGEASPEAAGEASPEAAIEPDDAPPEGADRGE